MKWEDIAAQFNATEFSEAAAMYRYFLEARIRILYYLYAFFVAIMAVLVTQLLNQWPQLSRPQRLSFLVMASIMSGLLALLSLLSWTTIKNWNVALSRYYRLKQLSRTAVLGDSVASEREREFDKAGDLPAGWAFTSTGTVSLLASVVFVVGVFGGILVAALGVAYLGVQPSQILLLVFSPSASFALAVLIISAPAARVQAAFQKCSTLRRWWKSLKSPLRPALGSAIEKTIEVSVFVLPLKLLLHAFTWLATYLAPRIAQLLHRVA